MTQPRLTQSPTLKLVGLKAPMSFARPAMKELWQRFRPRVDEVPHRVGDSFVSMRIYDPPLTSPPRLESTFVLWAAVEVTDFDRVPREMETHTVASGLYAVFTHRGTADSFAATARVIFGEWLPQSPYRLAAREFFEVLGPGYRPDDPEATEDVWIPVEPRS